MTGNFLMMQGQGKPHLIKNTYTKLKITVFFSKHLGIYYKVSLKQGDQQDSSDIHTHARINKKIMTIMTITENNF